MRLLPTVVLVLGCCVSSRPPLPDLDDAFRDYSQALPVFPGAEGFGTLTVAGRGGTVYVVDTLADDGVGSLRLPPDPNDDTDGDGYTNLEEWLHGYLE